MVVYLLKGKENQSVSEFLRNVIIQTLVSDSVCERLVSHCFWRFYGKTITLVSDSVCERLVSHCFWRFYGKTILF